MSINVFHLPDLGEGLTEADILHWLVAEGDTVAMDQPIVEVETAKSAVEIPSPFEGTVHKLHGAEGETLTVGQALIAVSDGAEPPASEGTAAPAAEAAPTHSAQSPEPTQGASYREEERAGTQPSAEESADDSSDESSGNVLIGYGTTSGGSSRRRRRGKSARASGGSATGQAGAASHTHDALTTAPRMAPTVISPLVRKLAKEHGVDITSLSGTGPGGLIMRQDIRSALEQVDDQRRRSDSAGPAPTGLATPPPAPPVPTAPAAPAPPAPWPANASDPGHSFPTRGGAAPVAGAAAASNVGAPHGRDVDARTGLAVAQREPVKGVRKAISDAMTRSRTEIPEATIWVDVDATELLTLRASYKAKDPQNAPSLLALLARFTLAGLRAYPQLCSRWETHEDGTRSIARFDGVNLGLAVESERGLLVPNLRNADQLTTVELNRRMREVIEVARSGKASPSELTGSTFTLNNYGVFGTDGATPIINHPEVGILGIGRIIDKPWVVNGELAVRKVTTLTLAFDHRVCDGGSAGGFLRFIADAVEDPTSAFLRM
ncbi:2-oxo acid dehydrogenase subunit E2 [Kocuria sp. cx-455]|uniref:dihydrolipoamide acetyltransferase family protein n=1 Tax=Kocuria sp. cx-455 TaxID=2771377 RepID=UPI001684FFF4|nr:dihydrolipoamide acetyltransferase family protein [Kocuria sp. cx-455]MBD2765729.1 2-oxo acid dehydrogenase subunit E2 [Kocuria sp. cx-455]